MAALLVWDRGRRPRPVAVQSAEAGGAAPSNEEEECIGSSHLVVAGERGWSAGDAAARMLRLLPGGAPLAALAERFPGATRHGYELASGHPGLIGRLTPRRSSDARRPSRAALVSRQGSIAPRRYG
jgi:predicted DCC family thiol-disulfide oxidoreductase YuxK